MEEEVVGGGLGCVEYIAFGVKQVEEYGFVNLWRISIFANCSSCRNSPLQNDIEICLTAHALGDA